MGKFIDLTGARYGRLTLVSRAKNRGTSTMWAFVCDCGRTGVVATRDVRSGKQISCGCAQREAASRIGRASKTHGHTCNDQYTPTYQSWRSMIERTTNPRHHAWKRYGGRGIFVCDRWKCGDGQRSGFECFLFDMGERPPGRSIDRIDNDLGYEPRNCRWATPTQQNRNSSIAKMKAESVQRLRDLAKRGDVAIPILAHRFGISRTEAYRIVAHDRWA